MIKKIIITTIVLLFAVLTSIITFSDYPNDYTIVDKLAKLVGAEKLPDESVPTVRTEMQRIATGIAVYRYELNEYPQGTSAEVAQALLGKNAKQEVILKFSRSNEKQEFLDPWKNPYEINISSSGELQIRSAGSNGVMGDDDDEILEDKLE
jgi:hypothetical protein